MTPRYASRLPVFASLLCISTFALAACDVDRTMPGDAELSDEPEVMTIADYTDNVELPADESIEPTGQSCEIWSAGASCLEPSEAAFCDLDYDSFESGDVGFTFGECLSLAELECMPGDTTTVETDCGDMQVECVMWQGVPGWSQPECWGEDGGDTPLVLRFDNAPITMLASEATPAATFDIAMAADGNSCITTDWPSAATPWLAVDLDHSGTIDGGHELFGSGTELAEGGKARNGFIALERYDANRDGKVDAQDPQFGELLLWRDYDGDRLSSPGELERLADAGVDSLVTAYSVARSCDERGNCAVERASFSHTGGAGEIVDLHLACQ